MNPSTSLGSSSKTIPVIQNVEEESQKSRSFGRWGKQQDKNAFAFLEKYAADHHTNIVNLLELNLKDDILLKVVIKKIISEFSWDRSPKQLLTRLKKVYATNQAKVSKFSVRDIKLLKRLVKNDIFGGNEPDYAQLQYHFPGKSLSVLKNEVEKYRLNYYRRN